MSLIFEIEQKPTLESKIVFGIEIPLFGELTVNEAIAVEKALSLEFSQDQGISNTLASKIQVSAWLAVRLNVPRKEVDAQLDRSVALIEALWDVFYAEKYYSPDETETDKPVTEGKDESEPLPTSIPNGTESTSSLQLQDLQANSLVVLDNSVSP